jgi:hypothetical protein
MITTVAAVIIFRTATSSATRSQQFLAVGAGAAIAIAVSGHSIANADPGI